MTYSKTRIATETATGRIYIVRSMDFPTDGPAKVRVWGEVMERRVSRRGRNTVHGPSLSFLKSEVEISMADDSEDFRHDLMKQGHRWMESKGYRVRTTPRGNYRIAHPVENPNAAELLRRAEVAERNGYTQIAEENFAAACDAE